MTEECFENQRFSMFKWTTRLLPTDRPVWSDRYGSEPMPRESFMLPSSEWTWAEPWLAVTGEGTDTEGWQYHLDFPRGSDYGWSALRNPAHFVRRRRWVPCQRPSVLWHAVDLCSLCRWTRTRLPPSGASGAGNALVSAARHDLTLASSLPLVSDGASSGVVSDDGAGVELDSTAPVLIPATASTLLALGVFMWGPPVEAGDLCSVRIGNSEWSRPWGLRTTVGRPALIVLKDPPCTASERKGGRFPAQYDVVASARPCVVAMDANSSADASDGRDGAALMLGGGTMIMSSQLGDVFRRSTLVTLSPRFVIVNRIDVIGLSDVFGQYLTGAGDAWVGSNSDRFGVFVLQVAQAGARDANGVSQPHDAVLQHLSGLASRGVGGERSYDIGTALAQRLKLNQLAAHPHSASPESALVAGLADLRASRVSACTTSVPLIQSVPPGEHAPLQWGLATGEPAASQNVCFRVVRLARPVTLDASLSPQPLAGATIVVPVTDWSGAVDLGQVAEVPIRLRGATGAASRLLHEGNPLPEVVLRVAVRSHRKRGTAMVVVTADAGVKPAAGMLGALSAFVSEEASGAPPPRHNRSISSGLGGLQPLLWASGVGEITVAEMQVVLVNERAVMAARRLWVDRTAAVSSADTSGLPPAARAPVYRIDNHTLDTFTIAQKGVVGFATRPPLVVPPRCSVVFAWDEPEIPVDAVAAANTSVLSESATGVPGAAAGAGGAAPGGVASGSALRRASSDGAASSHGGGSRLRILVRAVTTPLKPAEGSASLAARGPSSENVMDVDLNNVALAHSLRLPPGRVLDEESAEALLRATGAGEAVAGSLLAEQSPPGTPGRQSGGAAPVGSGRAVWARPLLYGSTVFVRGHGGGAVSWALGPLHLSPCLWPVVHLASGVISCSAPPPAFPGGPLPPEVHRSVPAGSPVLAAQCRFVEDDPGAAAAATPTADSGSSAAPISFECANRLFAWPGLRAAASTRTAASGSGAAPGEHGGVTVRYGDLVMIRHDAVVGAPVTAGSASPTAEAAGYAESVDEENTDEAMSAEVSAVRSQPLYLVSHRDGRVDWVQASDCVAAA